MEEEKKDGYVVSEAPATPAANVVGKLTEVESLKMENIVLRSEKLQLLRERIAGDLETIETLNKELQQDLATMRVTVAERLNVKDPSKIRIRKTGEVEEAP